MLADNGLRFTNPVEDKHVGREWAKLYESCVGQPCSADNGPSSFAVVNAHVLWADSAAGPLSENRPVALRTNTEQELVSR